MREVKKYLEIDSCTPTRKKGKAEIDFDFNTRNSVYSSSIRLPPWI